MARLPGEQLLAHVGHPASPVTVADSPYAFPDGGLWRTELPSCEGPAVIEAALAEADRLEVPLHRMSNGSGVWMFTDQEIRDQLALTAERNIQLCFFLGPRGAWGVGANTGARVRGRDQLAHSLEDAQRACELGVRSLLVADEGVLWQLHLLREKGVLPADVQFKISVQVGPINPASFRLWEKLGADSINVPSDLTVPEIAELRAASRCPIDFYVEAPDLYGGYVRSWDASELVRAGAPIYLKFGLRGAPDVYPIGKQIEKVAIDSAIERVHRGRMVLDKLIRLEADAGMSPLGSHDPGKLDRFED
jgi:hypothetical protein